MYLIKIKNILNIRQNTGTKQLEKYNITQRPTLTNTEAGYDRNTVIIEVKVDT